MTIGWVWVLGVHNQDIPPALTEDLDLMREGGGSSPGGEHHPFMASVASPRRRIGLLLPSISRLSV